MHFLLPLFTLIPLLAYGVAWLLPARHEAGLSRTAFGAAVLHLLLAVGVTGAWLLQGRPTLNVKEIALFRTTGYEFFFDFCFDAITATYLLVGSVVTFLITLYSRDYMHRERGYKRFFTTILLFFLGYNLTVTSGNFETLFIGWEVLGVSSFLLIAFYRDRYLPVKNAVKVFSIYRIGDIGLILALWLSHHLWHENITFLKLSNYHLVHEHLQGHTLVGALISVMILISAAAKSAQLPFSSWLPRAMEGPTPSSAIFYGSLSVHLGVFLLLRTYPFWEHQLSVRVLIGGLGLLTALIATGSARVQSALKSQIAYGSIAQIGLIFIEVALGWETLALVHFAGNAFLRTYQLLVSPSAVSYLIREQFYTDAATYRTLENLLPRRLAATLYILSLKEWNLDSFLYRTLWNPLKWAGRQLQFLTLPRALWLSGPLFAAGALSLQFAAQLPPGLLHALPIGFSVLGLLLVLKAFTERSKTRLSWVLVVSNHGWVALAISFNEHIQWPEIALYLSGVVVAGVVGFVLLTRLKRLTGAISLHQFHGHVGQHPRLGTGFLLCCLAVTGFPITPTFLGEDLIFNHIHGDQAVLAGVVAMSLLLDGLAIIRLYARVFLGPATLPGHAPDYRAA